MKESTLIKHLNDALTLGKQNQQAIEEITNKLLLTAMNVNMAAVRMAVTERIMKEKLGLTDDEITAAAEMAMQEDRQKRAEEQARQALETKAAEAATAPADGSAPPDQPHSRPAHHILSNQATPQTQLQSTTP